MANNRLPATTFLLDKKLKIDVCKKVVERMGESCSEKLALELWSHFDRLPARYAMAVNLDRVEKVLMHKKLLESAQYPGNRPCINICVIQKHQCDEDYKPNQHIHQITICTSDQPMLLSELSHMLAQMRLNIREAFAVSTKDGYSLLSFVVTGCSSKKSEQLKEALRKKFSRTDETPSIEATDPLQSNMIAIDVEHQVTDSIDRPHWSWLNVVEWFIHGSSALVAVYLAVVGISLMRGKMSKANVVDFVMRIGQGLLNDESSKSDKDIGVAIVFVAIPLLGILSVLSLLVRAIYSSMKARAKIPIIIWLIVDLLIGAWLPFIKTEISSVINKSSTMFSALVTILAAVTNFYRKD